MQPKQPALELAAEAALAAVAREAAPLAKSEGTTSKPAAEGASSRLQDSKQEGAYSADSTTQRGQLEPAPAAAAAVSKAAGKRPGMAQKLLAKANCFAAAFTSSPAKGIVSIEQLPSEAKVLHNAAPKAVATAAAVSTAPHEAAEGSLCTHRGQRGLSGVHRDACSSSKDRQPLCKGPGSGGQPCQA